ncbi:MAG: peptidoglycan DD-metalloendopeptidase family protein [Alloprevotella sp.]|nr:peptidoglycan DD-metalloendopeptidase family protein [Alloprevotella sp.]
MRKWLFLLSLLLLGTGTRAQTKQINTLKNQSAALQKQLQESEKMLNTTRKDVGTQLNNLALLNTQIGEQQKYVDGIAGEVARLGGTLEGMEQELSALQADLAECKRRYHRAMLYMFRNRSSQTSWMFVLSAKDFRQMYRRLRYVSEYSKFQRIQADAIREKERSIQEKKAEITGLKSEKDVLLAEGKRQQASLQQKKVQQQAVVSDLNRRQAELQKNIAATRSKQAALTARIDQLVQAEIAAAEKRRKAEEAARKKREEAARKKREEERRQAEARRKQEAARQQQAKGGRNVKGQGKASAAAKAKTDRAEERTATPKFVAPDNADRKLSGGFAANKGRLPVPITGSYAITARYGSYNPMKGVTLDNKGINLTGQAGAQARCVYDGEVSAIFTVAGLYNVIVRHGSYMSVYCNLSSVSVKRGQRVSTRQSLGTVARDASGAYTLHFQLRQETAKLNPEAWISR